MTEPTDKLLDPSHRAVAERRAKERGLSLSAYMRDSSMRALPRPEVRPATSHISLVSSGTREHEPTSPVTRGQWLLRAL